MSTSGWVVVQEAVGADLETVEQSLLLDLTEGEVAAHDYFASPLLKEREVKLGLEENSPSQARRAGQQAHLR